MWRKAFTQLLQGKPPVQVWQELSRSDPRAARAAAKLNRVMYDAEKLVDNVKYGKVSAANTAQVPFMVSGAASTRGGNLVALRLRRRWALRLHAGKARPLAMVTALHAAIAAGHG